MALNRITNEAKRDWALDRNKGIYDENNIK
jgi:hypothetical protein